MKSNANKARISPNSVSLAGEFAVLSHLALHGYDANMTLGRTKGVDILASNPKTNQFYRLEVKSKLNKRKQPGISKLFGRILTDWIMNQKHESISEPTLWYCFVAIDYSDLKKLRFFIMPSAVVAKYVREEHRMWLDATPKGKETGMRLLRIGLKGEKYKISTPIAEKYEDNWNFNK
jgi:hypothetical protein